MTDDELKQTVLAGGFKSVWVPFSPREVKDPQLGRLVQWLKKQDGIGVGVGGPMEWHHDLIVVQPGKDLYAHVSRAVIGKRSVLHI